MVGNLAYFEVPTDNIERAKKFYTTVFEWEIKNTPMPGVPDYSSVTTGKAMVHKGMSQLNMGGMMKRMQPGQPITNYIEVKNVDETIVKVKEMSGKQIGDIIQVPKVGRIAFIFDSENNFLGIWESEKNK